MSNFYSRLSYSFGNEDWRTEKKALKISPESRVLCVTASGDRPLNLLSSELSEMVAIDANPMQNALFELKLAAINTLNYSEYLAFLGVEPHPNRFKLYSKLEKELSASSVALWSRHPGKIARGVLYEGSMEKWLKIVAKILRPFRGKKIDTLFGFRDLERQQAYLNRFWHTFFWKKAFHVCLHPLVTRLFLIKDPGLYAHVDEKIHVGNHLYEKLHTSLDRFLANESILLSLILRGRVDKKDFPPYLTEEGFEQIKKREAKISHETIDMASYLEKCPDNSIDCFSCSDIASYITKKDFERIIVGIVRTARPGARFCIRQFLSNHQIPEKLTTHFERNLELEQELEKEDRCFVYKFMCGTIKK